MHTKQDECRAGGGPLIDKIALGDVYYSATDKAPLTLAYNEESGLLQLRYTAGTQLADPISSNTYWSNFKEPLPSYTSEMMFHTLEAPVRYAVEMYNMLAEDGVWTIVVPYLPLMLAFNAVDMVTHENLCYYTLRSLQYVVAQADLEIEDVEFSREYGGIMRVRVRKHAKPTPTVQVVLAREDELVNLDKFKFAIEHNKHRAIELLYDLREQGSVVMGWCGNTQNSSIRANTVLHYYGLDSELLSAIIDERPYQWSGIAYGTDIPIISEPEGVRRQPEYLFIFDWHDIERITKRWGRGHYIVCCPDVRIVSGD